MENILKIIFDKTSNNEILTLRDIDRIMELLVIEKDLNKYILNIDVQQIGSINLASYSNYTKKIIIYTKTIDQMVKDIDVTILNTDSFETTLYKNLSILQVILHEVEHANQQKIAYIDNTLEALIIRLSFLVNNNNDERLYELCPEERLAEIKSFEEIKTLISYINNKLVLLPEIIEMEELKRQLKGYHYKNNFVTIPIVDYFTLGNQQKLLKALELTDDIQEKYILSERFKYGFPISISEYGTSMKRLLFTLEHNFKNKIKIKM